MRLDLFVKLNYEWRTIKYYLLVLDILRDLLSDLINPNQQTSNMCQIR